MSPERRSHEVYLQDRWQGDGYIESPDGLHNEYGRFTLTGCTLSDLGQRRSTNPNDDGYWDWTAR